MGLVVHVLWTIKAVLLGLNLPLAEFFLCAPGNMSVTLWFRPGECRIYDHNSWVMVADSIRVPWQRKGSALLLSCSHSQKVQKLPQCKGLTVILPLRQSKQALIKCIPNLKYVDVLLNTAIAQCKQINLFSLLKLDIYL